ncbi:MAG: DNA-binding transcriptional regulator [Gammaproteobacteria bacterium]|nr:DNA-binding transcriptional regulator [Gammaproteobacteria bacterium]MCH9743586.1 DNA-binding transcriptional regulator [Gammaproteobacteria bacterium]
MKSNKKVKDKKKTFKKLSPTEAVLETAKGLYQAGVIDRVTMHEFDMLSLQPVEEMSPKAIKALRLREKVSQPVFAAYLNASVSTIKQWEVGAKRPRGPSLKLLNLVAKNGLKMFV